MNMFISVVAIVLGIVFTYIFIALTIKKTFERFFNIYSASYYRNNKTFWDVEDISVFMMSWVWPVGLPIGIAYSICYFMIKFINNRLDVLFKSLFGSKENDN